MLKNVHFREKILWGTCRDFLFTIDLLIGCLFNSQKVLHVQKRLWRDDIFPGVTTSLMEMYNCSETHMLEKFQFLHKTWILEQCVCKNFFLAKKND